MMETMSTLKHPPQAGSVMYNHKTVLAQAIVDGNTKVLEELLCSGADINEFSYFRGHGEAPLLTAVRYAREDMVTVLLSHGANVNMASTRGHTPLLRSSQRNYFSMLCQLLSHRADPNTADAMGRTALFWAIKLRNFAATEELLKYGASVNVSSSRSSLLHTAVAVDNSDVTKLLLNAGADVNAKDEFDETPLFSAVRVDNMEIVQSLLDRGSEVNTINHDLRTPLHLSAASVHNNVDLTQLLLDNGANVNSMDRYRNTPLVLSLRNYILHPNYSVAKCLMQHGSNLQDENSASALEWTVEAHGNFDVVKFAIIAGFHLTGVNWIKDILSGDPNRRRCIISGCNMIQEKLFVDFLRYRMTNPVPLTMLCREALRIYLINSLSGGSIFRSIQKLPLPESIKLFLMLEDE